MIWNYCYLNPGLTTIYNGEKNFTLKNGLYDLLDQNTEAGNVISYNSS